jgi:excisionase family DNA binding protein
MSDENTPQAVVGGDQSSPYLDTYRAARYLNVSTRTLERLRSVGGGPKFAKAGRRVLYRKEWLDEWIEGRCFSSTSHARANNVR